MFVVIEEDKRHKIYDDQQGNYEEYCHHLSFRVLEFPCCQKFLGTGAGNSCGSKGQATSVENATLISTAFMSSPPKKSSEEGLELFNSSQIKADQLAL